MQYDADGIAYSFATQAATIAVKAGLSFDLTDDGIEIESVADKIASRLMGGQIAYCPVFEQDLQAYLVDLTGEAEHDKLEVVAVAPKEKVEDPEHPGEMIEVDGSYDAVAYKWYKKGANDEEFKQLEGEYKPALTVTSSGEYYVVVFGMRHIVDAKEMVYDAENDSVAEKEFKYHTSIASSKSTICEIPAPIKLEITKEMAEHLVLAENPILVLEVERQKIEGEDVGIVSIVAEKTASAEKDLDLENAEFLPVGEASEGSEAIAEAWIWNGVEYASEEEAVAAKGEAEGEIEHREAKEAVPAVAGIDYLVDGNISTINMANAEEGYYKITIVNTLNNDSEETNVVNELYKYLPYPSEDEGKTVEPVIAELVCRVVKPATIKSVACRIVAADGNAPQNPDQGSVYRRDKIEAIIDLDHQLSDELKIQWYEVQGDKDPADEGADFLIEGATDQEFVPNHAGDYYFVAINKVEESFIELASDAVHFSA